MKCKFKYGFSKVLCKKTVFFNFKKKKRYSETLSNIEIIKYFNYEPRFNTVFTRDNLPRIKDRTYDIDLDDKQSKAAHWVSLFIDRYTVVYFDFLELNIFVQKY